MQIILAATEVGAFTHPYMYSKLNFEFWLKEIHFKKLKTYCIIDTLPDVTFIYNWNTVQNIAMQNNKNIGHATYTNDTPSVPQLSKKGKPNTLNVNTFPSIMYHTS